MDHIEYQISFIAQVGTVLMLISIYQQYKVINIFKSAFDQRNVFGDFMFPDQRAQPNEEHAHYAQYSSFITTILLFITNFSVFMLYF